MRGVHVAVRCLFEQREAGNRQVPNRLDIEREEFVPAILFVEILELRKREME